MPQFRFKLFILSALLLTLSSGLLFYKGLFLSENSLSKDKNTFPELRYLDVKINELMATERRHLEENDEEISQDLISAKSKIHDLIFIILDIHRNDLDIKKTIGKIESYFNERTEVINTFQEKIKRLRHLTNALNPIYRDIQKNNIKFTLDKRDFYRECITDAFFYLTAPSKANETQLYEDKKILAQVIAISGKPEPILQNLLKNIDQIITLSKEIDEILIKSKQKSIDEEMAFIDKYFKNSNISQNEQGQSFLVLVFIAIIFYIISLVVILRKF
jgi:hypothetical protein